MNNSPKEIAIPLNLNLKNKISSLLSNASKAPPSPKQPFFIGNKYIYIYIYLTIIIIIIIDSIFYTNFWFSNKLKKLGVAGGTASGKTTVCNLINSQFHDQRVVLINQVINSPYNMHYFI